MELVKGGYHEKVIERKSDHEIFTTSLFDESVTGHCLNEGNSHEETTMRLLESRHLYFYLLVTAQAGLFPSCSHPSSSVDRSIKYGLGPNTNKP